MEPLTKLQAKEKQTIVPLKRLYLLHSVFLRIEENSRSSLKTCCKSKDLEGELHYIYRGQNVTEIDIYFIRQVLYSIKIIVSLHPHCSYLKCCVQGQREKLECYDEKKGVHYSFLRIEARETRV